jgi:hypothetical protein
MGAEHEITVRVVSPEEAADGVAEFWVGDAMMGFTVYEDGELLLRIDAREDGNPVLVNAKSLADALAKAKTLLSSY